MALYVMGDLHLSFSANKSMEVFGEAWRNYVPRIEQALSALDAEDTLVLAGDTSWGIDLPEAEADFRFLDQFPCRKLLIKGNHDYWWTTVTKMKNFFAEKGIRTLDFLHNNCFYYGDYALCGTRGWFFEEAQKASDAKVLNREVARLRTSLEAGDGHPRLCFLHYPPLYQGYRCQEIQDTLHQFPVQACYYGHLHGPTHRRAISGVVEGIDYALISADYLGFLPKKICE